MSITKIRIILCLMLCCLCSVQAQTDVPKVRGSKHALLDIYAFTNANIGLPYSVQSLLDSNCDHLQPLGADFGAGIGFHMPDSFHKYMLRVGYHYQNFTYWGHYQDPNISLHYLDLDARVTLFLSLTFGVRADVRLSQSLPNNLPQEYLGYNIQLFNPAYITPYLGVTVPITSNLSFDAMAGWQLFLFNSKAEKRLLLDDFVGSTQLTFEVGITYRIFTTGKRQSWSLTKYRK